MERYIAIDVETPNAANDRISAIGICTVEDGAIQSRFYTLVDPETYCRMKGHSSLKVGWPWTIAGVMPVQVAFACTCQMGRRLLPQLPNHKLNTLCQYLEIPLEHHHAGSDSQACGALLCHYLGMGARMEEHIRCFDMQRLRVCHPGKEK